MRWKRRDTNMVAVVEASPAKLLLCMIRVFVCVNLYIWSKTQILPYSIRSKVKLFWKLICVILLYQVMWTQNLKFLHYMCVHYCVLVVAWLIWVMITLSISDRHSFINNKLSRLDDILLYTALINPFLTKSYWVNLSYVGAMTYGD